MGLYSDILNQSLTLKVTNGTDENSNPIISSTKSKVPCRIEFKNRLIINAQSKEITSNARVFLEVESVKVDDIVTINGKDYTVLQVSPAYTFDGEFDINAILI